jgi:subtilisin family serine protease
MQRLSRLGALAVLAVSSLLAATGTAAGAPAPAVSAPRILGAGSGDAVAGQYIVSLKNNAWVTEQGVRAAAESLAHAHQGEVKNVWQEALHGFAARLSASQAQRLAADPNVAWVQQEQPYRLEGTQTSPSVGTHAWGLDRLDQRKQPLNGTYHFKGSASSAGAGVHVYILDSGINAGNTDFGGRVTLGPNYVTSETPAHSDSSDCDGHGTAVAGVAAGNAYGVAKGAQLVAVRVGACDGSIESDVPIVNAINYVITQGIRPAVINLSLGKHCVDGSGQRVPCPEGTAQSIVAAEQSAIQQGIPVVTSAGEAEAGEPALDACGEPVGSAGGTINVGALNSNDSYASYSDFGGCVDIWAPGTDIQSDSWESPTATRTETGTSFAAPYVTGAVAVLLGTGQFAGVPANQLVAQVAAQIDANATLGQITGLPDGLSANKILYVPPTFEGSSVALAKTQAAPGQPTGALRAFGTNAAGNMFTTTQIVPNSVTWNAWTQSVNTNWLSVAADANADGRVQSMALTGSDQVWQRQQKAVGSSSFLGLSQISGALRSIAIARNQNGLMVGLGVNRAGIAFFNAQTAAGAETWGGTWTPFTGSTLPIFTSIAAETDSDNIVEAFAVDTHGRVWRAAQAGPNATTWSPFTQLTDPAGLLVSEVAVARESTGALDLIATDASSTVYQRSQSAPSASWTNWSTIGSAAIMHLAAETDASGTVAVLTVDASGAVFQMDQSSLGSSRYSGFIPLEGQLRP